jgi:hypothetical protein
MREDYFVMKSNRILNIHKAVHAYINKFNRSMVKERKKKKIK